jgi:hypothetical protein
MLCLKAKGNKGFTAETAESAERNAERKREVNLLSLRFLCALRASAVNRS